MLSYVKLCYVKYKFNVLTFIQFNFTKIELSRPGVAGNTSLNVMSLNSFL